MIATKQNRCASQIPGQSPVEGQEGKKTFCRDPRTITCFRNERLRKSVSNSKPSTEKADPTGAVFMHGIIIVRFRKSEDVIVIVD